MTDNPTDTTTLYVITNDSSPSTDPFAYTDDGIATARTHEQAIELKHWIAFEFMGWDSADQLTIQKAVLHPEPE